MIKATHSDAGYFTEYIYTVYGTEDYNEFDVLVRGCNNKSKDGYHCEKCYTTALYEKIRYNRSFLKMKKFLSYQLGLYENPQQWVKDFKSWIKYDNSVNLNYQSQDLIDEVIEEIIEVETPQADLNSFVKITNIFKDATIHQLNMGNGTQFNNYTTVLDKMLADGVTKKLLMRELSF